ncbi:MAG: N-acetylmuramoyl-L-alanine amidase [Alphaproteobacteria bacterium]
MIERPSPNFDDRRDAQPIDMLVLHYTGMTSAAAALERLCDPSAKVSAHYLIDEDGTVVRLVAEEARAWHAGVSCWRGHRDINSRSIGIELVNPGHEFGYRSFPEPQMASLEGLARDIVARHPIPPRNVVGHSDIAPTRKQDPGERFDWGRLARAGVGLWPFDDLGAPSGPAEVGIDVVQEWLGDFGYDVTRSGRLDDPTIAAVEAFQRHFRPALVQVQVQVQGFPDRNTVARLESLVLLARR